MVALGGLDAVLAGVEVLDLGKAELEVSLLCVGPDSIDGSFALGEGDVVFLVGEEGRSHYLMYVFLIFADGLALFEQFWLEELFVLILLLGRFWLRGRRLHLAVDDLVHRHVGVLILVLLLGLLLAVELVPLGHPLQFLVVVGVVLGAVLQPHLHVLHPAVEVADLPDLLLLALQVPQLDHRLPVVRLELDPSAKDGQLHHLLQVHVALRIDLDLEVVQHLVLGLDLLQPRLFRYLRGLGLPLLLLDRNSDLLGHQEVALLLLGLRHLEGQAGGRFGPGLILVGDLVIDDLDGLLEDECELQDPGVVVVYLIELQDKGLSDFINPEVVPLAPGPIVPQILLPILAVGGLNLLKLLHELQVDGADVAGLPEVRLLQRVALGQLDVDGDEEVAEELDVQELAPGGAQVEHELIEDLLVYLHAQEFEGVVVGQLQHRL